MKLLRLRWRSNTSVDNGSMPVPTVLFHYGALQPLWHQPGLLQAGPRIADCAFGVQVSEPSVHSLQARLHQRGWAGTGVLLHYSDPFLMLAAPLRGIRHWPGPKLLACGDLHHGSDPIATLTNYFVAEPHDALLITFNPGLVSQLRQLVSIPVRSFPPSFFRYPSAVRQPSTRLELLHVGSLGAYHPRRRDLVLALQARGRLPFRHATTTSAEEAAALYAQYALVLNVPLNQDLNHRFFEVMAAGVPQVVFGHPSLLGEHRYLAERPDVFWASSLAELEALVAGLLAEPERLRAIQVAPPPYWELQDLLKAAFAY